MGHGPRWRARACSSLPAPAPRTNAKVDARQLRDLDPVPKTEVGQVERLDRGEPDDEAVGRRLGARARGQAPPGGRQRHSRVQLRPKQVLQVGHEPGGGVGDDDADFGERAPVAVDAKVEPGAEERGRQAKAGDELDDRPGRLAVAQRAELAD